MQNLSPSEFFAMAPPVPRKSLSLKQRVEIIRRKDSSTLSIRILAEECGIRNTQVSKF